MQLRSWQYLFADRTTSEDKRGIEMDSDVSIFDCDANINWIWKIVEESEGWCVVMEVSISQKNLLNYVLRKELFFWIHSV